MASEWIEKRFEELKRLAEERFDQLSEAENKMLRAAITGDMAWCGPSQEDDDPLNQPSSPEEWGRDREIRADFVRWLCVDKSAEAYVDPQGIMVHGAQISSALNLHYASVRFRLGFFRCRFNGAILLVSASLPALGLPGSAVPGITADGAQFQYGVFLDDGFTATGTVRFPGAQIGGDLTCGRGTFKNPSRKEVQQSGVALLAAGASIKGSIFLRDGFVAEGQVSLQNAEIGGVLDCGSGTFKNPAQKEVKQSGVALTADSASIKGDVYLRDGFVAEGEVHLLSAEIGGLLDCAGGTFRGAAQKDIKETGTALLVDDASVKGSVLLRNGFVAEGQVRLLGAQIDGSLECHKAEFQSAILQRATVKEALFWGSLDKPRDAELDLQDASAGVLVDDQESWPNKGKLELDGFVYGRIGAGPKDSTTRLQWLDRQKSFFPQPYRQLAKVLREEGDDAGARRVLYEMEKLKHKDDKHGWPARLWNWVFRLTIGYGIYPRRAVWGLLILVALGWGAYRYGYFAGAISPSNGEAYKELHENHRLPPYYQHFYASMYSAENSFPLVNLGQRESWQPDPNQQGLAGFLRVFCWIQVILGWVLATFFVAGVTGIARKD